MPSNDNGREVKVVVQKFPPQDGGRFIGVGGVGTSSVTTSDAMPVVPAPPPPVEMTQVVFITKCHFGGRKVLPGETRKVPVRIIADLVRRGWIAPVPVTVPVPKVERIAPPPVEVVIVAPVEEETVMIADEGPEVEVDAEAAVVVDPEDEQTTVDEPDEDEPVEKQPVEDLLAMTIEQNENAGELPTFGMVGPRATDTPEAAPVKRSPGRPKKQPRTP